VEISGERFPVSYNDIALSEIPISWPKAFMEIPFDVRNKRNVSIQYILLPQTLHIVMLALIKYKVNILCKTSRNGLTIRKACGILKT
jgi:hypothetical protein